MLYYDD
jgi:hypothetical protein